MWPTVSYCVRSHAESRRAKKSAVLCQIKLLNCATTQWTPSLRTDARPWSLAEMKVSSSESQAATKAWQVSHQSGFRARLTAMRKEGQEAPGPGKEKVWTSWARSFAVGSNQVKAPLETKGQPGICLRDLWRFTQTQWLFLFQVSHCSAGIFRHFSAVEFLSNAVMLKFCFVETLMPGITSYMDVIWHTWWYKIII